MRYRQLSHQIFLCLLLSGTGTISAQTEICDNGIDDDNDGLIDCFDDDCSGIANCDGFFFGQPEPDCGFTPPPLDEIELTLLYQTDEVRYPIDQRSGVFIGDMNDDGIPDLVSRDNGPPRIQIFSGDDGRILQSIVTPTTHPFGQTAIADVDGDGLGDVFHVEYTGRLARYEFGNPDAVWRTANNVGDDNIVSTPQLGDINQDGRPEVYVGDRIFDALTGIRYVDGGGNVNVGGYATGNNSDRFPLYFDLYQPNDPKPGGGTFGPEANGMEYIAGNQVWTVDFTTGTANSGNFQLAAEYDGPTNNRDGLTSIADINGDGRMDVAVMDGGRVYAWDPYTNQRIGPDFDVPGTSSGGRINIGDFDGDGDVELGFAGRNIYIVRRYEDNDGDGDPNDGTWSDLWRKTGLDDGSQRTGSTLFDFDGDGRVEVVYSEEEDLFIYDGATGTELFRTTSRSGTRTEYPLVADVNGDGTAEIIVTAQERNGPQFSGTGWISVYTSANQPWVPARPVWNQHGYNVVNVNDDLTVPRFQQNPLNPALGDRYNNFLVQTAVGGDEEGNVVYPAPDAIIMAELDGDGDPIIDFSDCPNTITINLQVDNAGSAPLPASTPISFYDGDPSAVAANLITSTVLGTQVDTGGVVIVPVTIDVSSVPAGSPIWLSVNDPGFAAADLPFQPEDFPLTGTAECDYTNNVSNVGNVRCGEVCGNGIDDDGDGLTDEPNLTQITDRGCPGDVLPAILTDVSGGTWSVRGGSSIGTTVDNNGVVTLGNNFSGSPVTDIIRYDDGICTAEVTVTTVDDVPPAITCPGNQTVASNAACEATPADYTTQAQISDNCTAVADISVTQDAMVATPFTVGPNTVTLTATDQSGNQTSCTFVVTVVDRLDPVITNCPTEAEVAVDADCNYVVPDLTMGIDATDNCSAPGAIDLAQTPVPGTVRTGAGTNVLVTLTATDEAGNTANCTYTLTLRDETPPEITCPIRDDQTLSNDPNGNCTFILPDFRGQVQRQDNCSNRNQITLTQSPPGGTAITEPGTVEIIITATDEAGNSSTCTIEQRVLDRDPPQLICGQFPPIPPNPGTCDYTIPDVIAASIIRDNCGTDDLASVTQSPAAGTTFTGFFQNVTVTATDASGNSNICVTTLLPGPPPAPEIICPADQQLTADGNCRAPLPDYTGQATTDGCGPITVTQQPGPGTSIADGTTVTLTARNSVGVAVSCTFRVDVLDQSPPSVTCPGPQTIAVDGTCAVPLPDYTAAAATQDNCSPERGDVNLTQTPAAGTMYDITDSPVTVTLTATDAAGNASTCNFQVELMDNQPPMISCPVSPQTDALDENCNATIPDFRSATMVSSTCSMSGFTLTQSPAPGTVVTGEQTVPITITAADDQGNSVDCTFDYATEDVSPPTISCPADQTEPVDGDCEFVVPDYTGLATVRDNCSNPAPAAAPLITVTQSPGPGTTVGGAGTVTTITLTATDAAGNSANCSFDLRLEDRTPPTITCPADRTRSLDDLCFYEIEDFRSLATSADNCDDPTVITVSQLPQAGSFAFTQAGSRTVTLTATDQSGNTADCTFSLSVTDVTPPTITCPPSPRTLELDAACTATVPDLTGDASATDNCGDGVAPTVTQDVAAGTVLSDDGTTQEVTLTATDASGLTASCTVSLVLADVTPPSVICPAAQDLNLDPTGCSVAIPDLSGQLTLADNCTAATALNVQQMPAPGTVLTGANTVQIVTFTVDDGNGNTANCSVDVTLRDVTDPVATCPAPATLTLDSDCKATLPDYTTVATTTDNCSMSAGITLTQNPAPGTELDFNGEQLTVTIIADDGNGNRSSCTFPVTARDTEAPTLNCPADRDEAVSANCDFTLPDYTGEATVADNCSEPAGITVTQSPAVGTLIPADQLDQPQTITLTARDEAGNTVSCSFVITPVDATVPTIVCPEPQSILLDAVNCEAVLGDLTGLATVSDNCTDPAAITVTQDSAATNVYVGLVPPQITVVLTATDASGNVASCPVTVLIRDETDPTVDCSAANQTVALDENCNGQIPDLIPDLITGDNCSATALTVIQTPNPGADFGGDGTTVDVTFTVTDGSGNSVTCVSQITFEDQTPPVPTICPTDQTLDVDDNCPVPFPDFRASVSVEDNCRAQSDITLTQVPAPGTEFTGEQTVPVTITSDDGNGNTNSCTFNVVLEDNTGVQLTCPGEQLIIASSDNCDAVLPDYTGDIVTSDNCDVFPPAGTITQAPAPGTVLPPDSLDRPQTITITVDDGNGNLTSCEITATMVDTLAPVATCPANVVRPVNSACSYVFQDFRGQGTFTDNCATGNLLITQDPLVGSALLGPDATRTVTLTATDPSGNAASCSFLLTIEDRRPPVVTCPEPDTLFTDEGCTATVGDYRNQVIAQDDCTAEQDLIIVQNPPPGTVISGHLTTETITVTATDGSGNSSSCTFPVTAVDTLTPVIACPGDQVIRPDANCDALLPDYRNQATATDNCTAPGGLDVSQRPAPGTVLNGQGDVEFVTLIVDDGNGNMDSCQFRVTLEDNVPPAIACPADRIIDVDADCEYDLEDLRTEATATDNCTETTALILTQNIAVGTSFQGDGTEIVVTLTADDGNGNTAQCTTTLTLNDATPPTITCPTDQEIDLDPACEVLVPDYRGDAPVADNCTADAAIEITQVLAPGTALTGHNSVRTITLTADDGNGNTTDCSFRLRLNDATAPALTCPQDQEILVDGNCTATLPDYLPLATVTDNCNAAPLLTQNSPTGTVLDTLGVRTVTLTADDGNGNTTECNFLVTVRDQTPPELTCPERSVIPADLNCTVTLADYRDSILVSDNCGPTSIENGALTLVQSPLVGSVFSGRDAVRQVTITATDPSGNTVDCFITVELADTTRPTIVCPNDTTLAVDDNCAATVPDYTDLAEVADNCEQTSIITVTQRPVAGTPVSDEASLLTITLTATDENGNAVSCDFAVQLIDTLPPAVVCPADDLISVDGDCEVLLPDYRPNAAPTDNCSTDISLEQRPAPGTPLSGDGTTQTVTIIATDESGNVDSCQLTVTLEDSTEPMISCPADQELTADGDCEVVIPDYTGEAIVSSACDQSTLTVTQTPAIGTTISGHNATETITLTATDGSGNSVSCSFTVILIDRSPPVITDCQRDTIGVLDESCRYVLPNYWSLGPAAAQDDCRPSDQITYTQTPPPGTVLEDAFTVTTVTLIADDGNGNTVSCDFALTLTDTLSPTIACPADTVANPDGGCDFSLEDYTGRAVVADNCTEAGDLTVSQSPAPGTVISGQATSQEITLTVTDASGNSVDCSFTLSLRDTIAPTIDCPADKVENLTTTCDFTVPDYTGEAVTDDNCTDPAAITITQSPAAGTPITGQNEGDSFNVTLTADDGNGNTTDCSFTVTLDDAIDPVITCAADSTVFVDAACAAVLPDLVVGSSATDNCGAPTITQSPLPGEEYLGDDTQISVTLTADDGNGNTSQCRVTVTLQDTISPTIVCPPSEVLLTDGDCEVMLPDYRSRVMIMDNCTTTGGITVSQDVAPGTVFSGEGTRQIVTLTADDGNGNTTNCTLEITVDDNVPPTIICPPTQTQFTDADCQVILADYTGLAVTEDNCTDGDAVVVTQAPAPGTVFTGVRNVVITLTADDGNGNTTTCDFTFLVRDATPPQLTCPATQQEVADANCVATIGDYTGLATATDNCSVAGDATNGITLTQSPPAGTIITGFDQSLTVTITATDSSGNFTTCDFLVELIDETEPTITCPPAQTLFTDADCATVLDDYRGLATGADNCDQPNTDLRYEQSPAAGLPLNGDGTIQEVSITVTDRSGNQADCAFTVTVRDTISPTITCPPRDTISVDQSCPVAIGDYTDQATVADNCTAAAAISVTQTPDPATEFMGDGTIIDVTLTADDGNGNMTSCTFRVELEDQTDPTIACPGRQVLLTDATCAAVILDYRDLADASSVCGDVNAITLTQDPVPNTVTLTGDSTLREITITATDDAQPPNVVSCTFEVILVDNTPPTITVCPPAQTIFVDENCAVALPDFRANLRGTDNCEAFPNMEVAQTPVPGTLFTGDDTEVTVTYTLDDTNGNSVTCTSTVSLQDTISPSITCPNDQTVFTDGNCEGVLPDYTDATVADNCTTISGLTVTQVSIPGTLLSGFNDTETVTLTVNDGNGNTASCNFTVTLADDDAPTITCPPSQTIDFATDCGFTVPDYRPDALLDDNCAPGLLTVQQIPSPDSVLNDLGTAQEVVLTVTDAGGNTARCAFTVTTTSSTPPPAIDTIVLAVIAPPTGSGTVNLLDAFDPRAISNLSGRDLDGDLDEGIAPYTVSFYQNASDANGEVRGLPATNYDPTVTGDTVVVRVEDPATGCFVLSRITLDLRTPGTSGVMDLIHCNRRPFLLEIDGLPQPGGANTTIVRHEWRIISAGTTRLTAAQLSNADARVVSVGTEPLRSGTFVLEYQFFEDYGGGALVPSIPKRVAVAVENVGAGDFFWDGQD